MKNLCIAGCGRIGQLHAKNLQGAAKLYFHSRSMTSAENLNRRMGGVGVIEQFDEVLRNDGIDALILATPPEFHCAQTVAALRAGKSVLVEKPLCISALELAEIEAAAKNQMPQSFLMIAENYYYKPSLRQIKRLLTADQVGAVERVDVKKLFNQTSAGWRTKYGSLLEGGIHFVALIGDIVDDHLTSLTADFPDRSDENEPERHCELQLTYANGVEASLKYAWNVPSLTKGLLQHSRIEGTSGRIAFESNGLYTVIRGKHTAMYPPHLSDLMGYRAMSREFVHCLEDPSSRPYSNLARAKRDLEIVFRAYDSNAGIGIPERRRHE